MISFQDAAFVDYQQWKRVDPRIHDKITRLINEIRRDPFHGTGKPEPLKGNWSGYWSRRITEEHRLIYHVTGDHVVIVSCKAHY